MTFPNQVSVSKPPSRARQQARHAIFLLVSGVAACAADSTVPEDSAPPKVTIPVADTIAATDPVYREDASPAAVAVHVLGTSPDKDTTTLRIEAQNRSKIAREIWLDASGVGFADKVAMRRFGPYTLGAEENRVIELKVSDLPLQSSVLPVRTTVAVSYVGLGEKPEIRPQAMAGVFQVRHTKDFAAGRVSDASAPFESILVQPAAHEVIGRIIDGDTAQFIELDAAALDIAPNVQLVGTSLLDEAAFPDWIEMPSSDSGLIQKAASTKFCSNISYMYFDTNKGEDRLTGIPITWMGQVIGYLGLGDAAYVKAQVKRGSTSVWSGFLDGSGCTPSLATPAGTYTVTVFSAANRANKEWQIFSTDTNQTLEAWSTNVSVTASTAATLDVLVGSGTSEVQHALLVASTALATVPSGFKSGVHKIFAKQGCQGTVAGGCASGSNIWVGTNFEGAQNALRKFVLAHEIGHVLQHDLFGPLSNNYSEDSGGAICECDHVTADNNLHCMQGREKITTAQVEGWGHYIAATIMNYTNQTDCTFNYYKEVAFLGINEPPFAFSCTGRYKWMDSYCPTGSAGLGIELDWMNFYWAVGTQTTNKFSLGDMEFVYEEACGGPGIPRATCSGQVMPWATLRDTVTELYGATSAKRSYFVTSGADFGVDN